MLKFEDFGSKKVSNVSLTGGANYLYSVSTDGGLEHISGAVTKSDEIFFDQGRIIRTEMYF